MKKRLAVYPGTFDPMTTGHLDIIRRGLAVFDHLIVAIAENVRKAPLFDRDTRMSMIIEAVGADPRVEVDSFDGLIVEYARKRGASALLRGLRALSDFEYEFQFALMNKRLASEIETVFMMTGEESFYVSSSLVREVASFGGDVTGLVPDNVHRLLEAHVQRHGHHKIKGESEE